MRALRLAAPLDGLDPGHPAPYGWAPALVLVLVTLVDRVETMLVAGVLPHLQAEWGFSDTWAGALPAAVAVAGVLVSLPAGYLADRVVRTRLIAVVVAAWSLITLGSAVAWSFAVFFATRVTLGAADSLDAPAGSSLIADYYPPSSRARVYGYYRMAYFAGPAVGVLLGGAIAQAFGWRAAFLAVILPGLVVAWLCWSLHEPPRGGTDPVPAAAVAGRGLRVFAGQVRALAQIPTIVRVFTGLAAVFFGLNGVFFWLPTFFARQFDLPTGTAGALTAFVGLVGVLAGAWAGGVLGDRFHGRIAGVRVLIGGWGLLTGSVVLVLALRPAAPAGAAAALALAVLLLAVAVPNLMAAIADTVPAVSRGTGFGVLQLLVILGAAAGPLAVGALSDALAALDQALTAVAVPILGGSLAVLAARRTYEPDSRRALGTG